MSYDTMCHPIISVIIPCYNAGFFVKDAIQSVLDQTYSQTELILVDNNSTDNTLLILNEHVDKAKIGRVETQGVSFARNYGASLARGSHYLFLDADDVLANDALTKSMKKIHQSNYDIVYSKWQFFNCTPLSEYTLSSPHGDAITLFDNRPDVSIVKGVVPATGATLMKKSIFDTVGGWDTGLKAGEDLKFWFDAALAGASFGLVEDVGLYVRETPNSLSRRDPLQMTQANYIRAHILNKWSEKGYLSRNEVLALTQRVHESALAAFDTNYSVFMNEMRELAKIRGYRFGFQKADLLRLCTVVLGYTVTKHIFTRLRTIKSGSK